MLYNFTKHGNHEWNLSYCETEAQFNFWDKFLDAMAEYSFNTSELTRAEEAELAYLFTDYTTPYYGFPQYSK